MKDISLMGDESTAWRTQPRVPPRLQIVMTALSDLASSRGQEGIPFGAVVQWAGLVGIDVWWLWKRIKTLDHQVMVYKPKGKA